MGPYSLNQLSEHINQVDVFICCASFEERCKSIPLRLASAQVGKVLLGANEDIAQHIKKNANQIKQHFAGKAKNIKLNLSEPLKVADNLATDIDKVLSDNPRTFVIDVTTFTRESMLILLALLRNRLSVGSQVKLVYATANDYSIGYDVSEKWLSKGIKEIRSILGYPGETVPSQKSHLLVLAGFENERAAKLIDAYESTIVSVGLGSEEQSISGSLYEANLVFRDELCSQYPNTFPFSFSLIDPLQAKTNIEAQISAYPGHNLVIAPLNNKISTIGAALAAFNNPDIQLCYAQANYYNFDVYSIPGDEFYIFDVSEQLIASNQ